LRPLDCCGSADKKEVFRAWRRGTISDSKLTLYGPAKSKLIPKEELFLALKGGPAKGELERDFDILRLANASYFVLKEQLRAT
jgi:hypothetical protein